MEYIKRRPENSGRFAVLLYFDLAMAAVRFYCYACRSIFISYGRYPVLLASVATRLLADCLKRLKGIFSL